MNHSTCEYRVEWWQSIAGRRVRRHRLCGHRALLTLVFRGSKGTVSRCYCATHQHGDPELRMAAIDVKIHVH